MGETEVVLFDLGGVLIELGGVGELSALIGAADHEETWRRWLGCPVVRRYERGQCSTEEFCESMIGEWSLSLTPEEFLARFRRWPRGLFPGALELLAELDGRVRRACFSNTNELHWRDQFRDFGFAERLEHHFVSHEMGLVKPDLEAFEHVVRELACAPDRILFLDDNQINIEGARAAGLEARRVRGVVGARAALAERGILP